MPSVFNQAANLKFITLTKGSGSGSDPTEMVRHVQDAAEHQLMHFYTDRNLGKMLAACVLHYMIDVKSLASELLAHFHPRFDVMATVFRHVFIETDANFRHVI